MEHLQQCPFSFFGFTYLGWSLSAVPSYPPHCPNGAQKNPPEPFATTTFSGR
jgi:hypothetical protein